MTKIGNSVKIKDIKIGGMFVYDNATWIVDSHYEKGQENRIAWEIRNDKRYKEWAVSNEAVCSIVKITPIGTCKF